MRKLLVAAALIATFSAAPTVLASTRPDWVGYNVAKLNINVRSKPWVGDNTNRINWIPGGERVIVIKQMKDWCEIRFKRYRHAYVYCPNLRHVANFEDGVVPAVYLQVPAATTKVITSPTVAPTSQSVTTTSTTPTVVTASIASNHAIVEPGNFSVRFLNTVLSVSQTARTIINANSASSFALAQSWDKDAKLLNVNVKASTGNPVDCTFTYASAAKAGHSFVVPCSDPTIASQQSTDQFDSALATSDIVNANTYNIPPVSMSKFIYDSLGPESSAPGVVDAVRKSFDGSSSPIVNVSLNVGQFPDVNGGAPELTWQTTITQANSSNTLVIYRDANDVNAQTKVMLNGTQVK